MAGQLNSTVFGPVAVRWDGTVYVAAGNGFGNSSTAPDTLPVAFICTPSGASYTCVAATATFKQIPNFGSPYIGTNGIAEDATGNAYVATLLTNFGVAGNLERAFYGFQLTGVPVACSSTPLTCPVDLLPAAPAQPTPAQPYPAYALATGPAGQ